MTKRARTLFRVILAPELLAVMTHPMGLLPRSRRGRRRNLIVCAFVFSLLLAPPVSADVGVTRFRVQFDGTPSSLPQVGSVWWASTGAPYSTSTCVLVECTVGSTETHGSIPNTHWVGANPLTRDVSLIDDQLPYRGGTWTVVLQFPPFCCYMTPSWSGTVTITDADGTTRTIPWSQTVSPDPSAAIYQLQFFIEGAAAATPEQNRSPVARADAWTVLAGHTLDENLLRNDFDPDGDPIRARVRQISFASREWSGVDTDGGFLYTAGPGTSRSLRKTVTYVAVDDKGAISQPARAVITLKPRRKAKRNPTAEKSKARPQSAASIAPYWSGPYSSGQTWHCFGSGLKTSCFYMLSVKLTAEFNRDTGWAGSTGNVARACFKYGLIPLKNAACAKKLGAYFFQSVKTKSVINNAATIRQGNCLMYRVARRRTLRAPRAGEWGKPEFLPLASVVAPWTGNSALTGYGTWPKGTFGFGTWRVPLFCDRNGQVQSVVNEPLRELR